MKLDMAVHPVADLFPMLPQDELADLAADIKERGQLQEIVLDKDGRILDGRNRFAACKLAGVEPKFVTYDGDDPDGYALAVNVARRHMTKGQKAIVIAKACLQNKQTMRDAGTQYGVSAAYIAKAQVVLEHAKDLEAAVLSTSKPLNEAYDIALKNKKQAEDDEGKLAQLRREAPDLADLVGDGEITFEQAIEQLEQREEDLKRAERVAPIDVLVDESGGDALNFTQRVEAGQLTWAEAENLAIQWKREFDEAVERNCRRIENVASGWAALSRFFDAPSSQFNQAVAAKLGGTLTQHVDSIRNEIADKVQKWEGNTR